MIHRAIKVKVEKESNSKVTLRFLSTNSRMPVSKDDFAKRVKDGVYDVVGS